MGHRRKLPALAPLASPGKLAKLHGRSAEGQLLRRIERGLTEQLGDPTPAEQLLIHKCAVLSMRFEVLHQDYMNIGTSLQHKDKFLISLATVATGILAKLGLKQTRPEALTLEHYVAANYDLVA